MTNQEAIEFLKIERDHMTPTLLTERIEAMDMAISALKAQPTQTNTPNTLETLDCVERQKAIDVLMEFDKKLRKINWYQYPYTEYECRGVDEAIVKIANLPSAQPDGWLEQNKDKILQAGMEGREIDFRIGGRLFAIREKAQ